MQIGGVFGFPFRKVAALGPYLAIVRRGKMPELVIAFVAGAAILFGEAERAGAKMSPPTGVGNDPILWAEPLAGEIRLDGILDEAEWQTPDRKP